MFELIWVLKLFYNLKKMTMYFKNYDLITEFVKDYYYSEKSTVDYNRLQDEYGVNYEIAMPGFKKEDVKIEFKSEDDDSYLNIKTEKPIDSEKKYAMLSIKQNHNVNIKLDAAVFDVEKITAKMEDGILYLNIPKKEDKLPKKVEIKVG
jgi:HSP20 family protein